MVSRRPSAEKHNMPTGPRFAHGRGDVQLIGESDPIRQVREDVVCAARADAKVLITGETGVGKEVVARLIHQSSSRASKPLVTVNCAGLPDSLLESELFGHARGSFTGAYRDRPGLLEMAQNGTVFLDEVGEMSMRMQVVLLRFLETGEIQRVGADRAHMRVNARLITATNRNLQQHVASGAFRDDLYFRLNVIRILIAPLRERPSDIPLLVEHLVDVCSRQHGVSRIEVSTAAMDILVAHRWSGNIRELKNVVERLVLKANGRMVHPEDLPSDVTRVRSAEPACRGRQPRPSVASVLASRMIEQRESFWSTAYVEFMARDLTRDDLRRVIEIGLERTSGNYRLLTRLFGMADDDYKRFLGFLRKHDCHLPFQQFRTPNGGYGLPKTDRPSSAGTAVA